MPMGAFHRHVGVLGFDGRDYTFQEDGSGGRWLVDPPLFYPRPLPLNEKVMIEATRSGFEWLSIDRIMMLGSDLPEMPPKGFWARLIMAYQR